MSKHVTSEHKHSTCRGLIEAGRGSKDFQGRGDLGELILLPERGYPWMCLNLVKSDSAEAIFFVTIIILFRFNIVMYELP